jgi:hypothetical protein
MTPDPTDRWNTMAADLAGDALPALPEVPGRVVRADDSDDDDAALACLEAMQESLRRARMLVAQLQATEAAGWPVATTSTTPGIDPLPNPDPGLSGR